MEIRKNTSINGNLVTIDICGIKLSHCIDDYDFYSHANGSPFPGGEDSAGNSLYNVLVAVPKKYQGIYRMYNLDTFKFEDNIFTEPLTHIWKKGTLKFVTKLAFEVNK